MAYTQKNNGIKNKKTKKKGGLKKFIKSIVHPIKYTLTDLPKEIFKENWKKHGPTINPSTKNPKGIGK